jgi:hypothetical protein
VDSDSSVTGYILSYGTSSGNYPNSVNLGNVTSYTLNLSLVPYYLALAAYDSNGDRSANTSELVIYPVSVSAGSEGSISPNGNFFLQQGTSQTFTITPPSGYQVSNVVVDGVSYGPVTTYTLSNIAGGHTVTAYFASPTSTWRNLIWAGTGGSASLWALDNSNNLMAYKSYGPYGGWTPVSYSFNSSSGTGTLVWAGTGGSVSLWTMDGSNNLLGYKRKWKSS